MYARRMRAALGQGMIVVGSLVLATSPAQAWDDEALPGASCGPVFDKFTHHLVHAPNGSFINGDSLVIPVSCPVQRDEPGSAAGVWAAVYINNPSGQTTSCTFYSSDVSSAQIDAETQSSPWSGFQALYFTNVNSSASWGNYHIYCALPPGGTIHSYYVYES